MTIQQPTLSRKRSLRRQRSPSSISAREWLLAIPAAVGIVLGTVLMLLLLSASRTYSPSQLQQRAIAEMARGDLPAAAIDYRRLLQQFPQNSEFREGLNLALHLRPDPGPS